MNPGSSLKKEFLSQQYEKKSVNAPTSPPRPSILPLNPVLSPTLSSLPVLTTFFLPHFPLIICPPHSLSCPHNPFFSLTSSRIFPCLAIQPLTPSFKTPHQKPQSSFLFFPHLATSSSPETAPVPLVFFYSAVFLISSLIVTQSHDLLSLLYSYFLSYQLIMSHHPLTLHLIHPSF